MNVSPVLHPLVLFLLSTCHGEEQDDSPASGVLATSKVQKRVEAPLEVSCPEPTDIEPCVCSNYFSLTMDCSNVEDEEQLRKVFSAFFPSKDFQKFEMSYNKGLKVLEDGVFGDVSFKEFDIFDSVLEAVRDDALTPSLSTLTSIKIDSCQLAIFPFERLEEFTSLKILSLYSNKIHSLPPLSSSSLKELYLFENPISELSPEVFTLLPAVKRIFLDGCNLTEIIPGTFRGLPELEFFDLSENKINYLHSLTFDLVSSASRQAFFVLSNNNIDFVEVDAFKGVSGSSNIFMANNALTTLEELVWRPVLEKDIYVILEGNDLLCGCDVAWLIRDPELLTKARYAQCADGTMLTDLIPADFDICG